MNSADIISWAEGLWNVNSKIQQLNIVRLRPDNYVNFNKGIYNSAFVFSKRDKKLYSFVEGEYLSSNSFKVDEMNQDDLIYIGDFIKTHNGGNAVFSNMVVFFRDGEMGLFLIEQRK